MAQKRSKTASSGPGVAWKRIPDRIRAQAIDGIVDDDSREILAWKLGAAVRLENHYSPWEFARAVARFVAHCEDERLREAIGDVTPDEMYRDRHRDIVSRREKVERLTLERRKKENLRNAAEPQTGAGISSKPIGREV